MILKNFEYILLIMMYLMYNLLFLSKNYLIIFKLFLIRSFNIKVGIVSKVFD